jgi:iron complex transport system substrate-binding protein
MRVLALEPRGCRPLLSAALFALSLTGPSTAREITDIVGRTLSLDGPAERVILGEGRFIAALGVLGITDPIPRIAGTLNEFRRFDPGGFARYAEAFPGIETLATFGQTSEASVSLEKAIALQPDAAIFGVEGHGPSADARVIIDALEAAGIPVVFIDFRTRPLENTARSIEIMGRVLGREDAAAAFASRYRAAVAEITERLEGASACPSVFIDLRVGLSDECCPTIARGLLAELVEAAGGCNIAADALPGAVGSLNLEYLVSRRPDVYIGTAVGRPEGPMAGDGRIILGPGIDRETARASLRRALDRPGIGSLPAVRRGRAHGIWHHFYNSPLNIVALQYFARWIHPDLFSDLAPEETLDDLLATFGPVDLDGVYGVSLR